MVNNLNSISKFGGMPRVDRADALRTDADVAFWPLATEIDVRCHVGDRGMSGLVVLRLSFVVPDPLPDSRQIKDFTVPGLHQMREIG